MRVLRRCYVADALMTKNVSSVLLAYLVGYIGLSVIKTANIYTDIKLLINSLYLKSVK